MIEKLRVDCDKLLSPQQLACHHCFYSIPRHGKDILVYSSTELLQQPLLLTGHHGEVSAMTFGKGNSPVLLCSASDDYIIVWDLELCKKRTREGRVAAGIVIGALLGRVVHLSFCFSDERVAACSEETTYILNSKKQEVMCTLVSHQGPLTSAEFCPWNKNLLVTTSEDRTFKVWDLQTEALFYQSFVLSASPLLTAFFWEENKHLIIGSNDGQVWCFSLNDDHKCHLVTKMDLQKMEKRHKVSRETVKHEQTDVAGYSQKVETSKPVLKIASCRQFTDTNADQPKDDSWFCIGSSDGLYVVDLATSELQTAFCFKDHPDLSLCMAGSWSISSECNNKMVFLVSSLFTPCVVLLELFLSDLLRMPAGAEGFSVFPSSPPLLDSPLKDELRRKEPSPPKQKGAMMDKPVVFHSKVKSSGYTCAPRKIMFTPKTNVPKVSSKKTNKNRGLLLRDYPVDSAAPTVLCTERSIANKQVLCLQFSGDGKQILCGVGDNSVLMYKSRLTDNPSVYIGHDKPVSCVSWSLNRQWWLSASDDLSLRVWTHCCSEPAIIMDKNTFSKPIRGAQFYYIDKFLLLASGPSLHLYLYHVDTTRDDIKRYKQQSVIKRTSCLTTTSATDIAAMSSINDFLSYIVLVGGFDRSMQVFDMNKGAVVWEVPDAHSRVIHCIVQNKGSAFSTQPSDSYNLFLTSAVTDGVKIWDLRTPGLLFLPHNKKILASNTSGGLGPFYVEFACSLWTFWPPPMVQKQANEIIWCVRRYDNHVNRCHQCSAAISPCGRFIASGSEDNCAYVYDIRSSIYLHKLQKHSDTVLSVAFSPATPELLTGTLDGKLRLFRTSSGSPSDS